MVSEDIQKHAIIGRNIASLEQMIKFVKKVNPSFNENIAVGFIVMSRKYGIRGDIAFCQSIHETNWFRYGGDVKPEQNNFAGIGVTGNVSGNSFETVEEGITAQIQHLYAYATEKSLPEGEKLVDPRFHLVERGSAPFWEDLAGKWAYPGYSTTKYSSLQEAFRAGETYGQQIIKLYESLLKVEPVFKSYDFEEFNAFIQGIPTLTRDINNIQIHHTWKPRKTDYVGESTIVGMWRYHTQTRGWDDIAQHFTVSPDGMIWDGRSLNWDPAGIAGHNEGSLMFEMIGDFDKGEEVLEGRQLEAVTKAVKICMKRFNITLDDLVFHREYSSKTCPGSGISKAWFLEQIQKADVKGISTNYPSDIAEWKQEAVDWMYDQGLLTSNDWKQKVNESLPLWAEAVVLKRLFERLN